MRKVTFGTICTGVGAIDLGFERQGMKCVWQIEIDKACKTVLRKHFPKTKIYDDATKEGKDNLEEVDAIAGGTPCQGFSIAGFRKGLQDDRSNLCFHFCRICDELNPNVIVWENVPGVLSMEDNAFGNFIAALVGFDTALVHPDSQHFKAWWRTSKDGKRFPVWPRAGMVVGPKRTAAWRILDSQYLGVPQRRERVYVVANPHSRTRSVGNKKLSDSEGFYGVASKILFESEMLRRHSPPSRESGKDIAGTLGSSPKGSGFRTDLERTTLIPEIAKPLGAHALSKGRGTDLDNTTYIPSQIPTHEVSPALQERGGKGADSDCIQAHVITPPLTANPYGDNASRENMLVTSFAQNSRDEVREIGGDGKISGSLSSQPGVKQQTYVAIGFDKGRGESTGIEISGTLRCNCGKSEGVNNGKADNQCVAFQPGNISAGRGSPPDENVSPTLRSENDGDTRQCVAFHMQQDPIPNTKLSPCLGSGGSRSGQATISVAEEKPFMLHSKNSKAMCKDGPGAAGQEVEVARALDTNGGFSNSQGGNLIARRYQVRRLTPVECERLQAFPDDFTKFGLDKNGKQRIQKDSPRYRQIGNAWTTYAADFIGRRILKHIYDL